MNCINFYHLKKTNTYLALRRLVEKALEKEKRVLIRTNSKEVAKEIDEILWSFDPTSFLPHSIIGDSNSSSSPIYISNEMENLNKACYLFIVNTKSFTISEICHSQRTFILFNDNDKDFINVARNLWVDIGDCNLERKYWIEDTKGWLLKDSA